MNFSGCNYSSPDKKDVLVDRIEPFNTKTNMPFTGENLTLINVTKKYEDSLKQLYPFFTKENCALFSPEALLNKIYKQCENTDFTINDFTSEAGIDYYFIVYASLLKKWNDSLQNPQTEYIRTLFNNLFSSINSGFSCISDGGTMYYHNSNRIPGYVEWELVVGRKKNFTSYQNTDFNDIEKVMIQKGLEYQKEKLKEYQKSKEDISNCISLRVDSIENNYCKWIRERALVFISQQY
jgi:hypothetical protein